MSMTVGIFLVATLVGVALFGAFLRSSNNPILARVTLIYSAVYSFVTGVSGFYAHSGVFITILLASTLLSFLMALAMFMRQLTVDDKFRENSGFGFLVSPN